MTVQQAAQRIQAENPGVRVRGLQHRAKRPDGRLDGIHWHFDLENVAGPKPTGKAATTKALKPITKQQKEMVESELTTQLEARGLVIPPQALAVFRAGALRNYQGDGNPVTAVRGAIETGLRNGRENLARRPKAAPKTTAPPAANRPTATNAKGEKMQYNGSAWVAVK